MNTRLERATPESVGVPPAALLTLLRSLKELDSMNSVMILRHGKVCFECWWRPFAPDLRHILFSLSKSFTSLAVGFARAEGRLALDDRLVDFFPERAAAVADPKMRRVTLRHLLTMASGHAACARPAMLADPEGDWARGFLSSKLDWEPGSRFAYNSAATYMLAAVVRRLTGANVREYLIPRLFAPLGVVPGMWERCPRGTDVGGWGLYLRTEDIAKFAQLLLQGGVWEGRQILPADYLREATAKQIDNSMNEAPDWKVGYGYQFWQSRHGYRGDGASGQYAVVLPEEDMAIATTAGLSDMQRVLDLIWDLLLPALRPAPLPDDPAGREALAAETLTLAVPLAQGDLARRRPPLAWDFAPNPAGISRAEFACADDFCSLVFTTPRGKETVRAGFGHDLDNVLQLQDHLPRRVMASAAWTAPEVLEMHLCCYETSFREIFRVNFADAAHPLAGACRFNTFRAPFLPELTVR